MVPKKARILHWTYHAREKMRYYRLSEQRIRHVLHSPKRTEEGVAPRTIAVMQPNSYKTLTGKQIWKQEIWVMFQDLKSIRKIISAWRYPGMTKPRGEIIDAIKNEYQSYLKSGDGD